MYENLLPPLPLRRYSENSSNFATVCFNNLNNLKM